MGPQSPPATPTRTDPLRQGPRETPQTQPLRQTNLWLPRQGPLQLPFQPDEEAHRCRRIQDNRDLAPTRGVQAQEKPATGLVQAASLDSADPPVWSSRNSHDTRRGLGDPRRPPQQGLEGFPLGSSRGRMRRVRSRTAYSRLTWQGLGNARIHVSLVLMVA